MGRSNYPGLRERNGHWYINGLRIKGHGALYESIGRCSREEAEAYYLKRVSEIRQGVMFGTRPERTFREAASHYLETEIAKPEPKASLSTDASFLKELDSFIGNLELDRVHDGTLAAFVKARRSAGNKTKTVNLKLALVRRVLNLAATKWRDEVTGLTWLAQAPKIDLLPLTDARLPYPLSWDEQRVLFAELPDRLARMALFAVNTGCRDGEICGLRWEWEQLVEELGTSVFVLPRPKNRIARVVILNRIARTGLERSMCTICGTRWAERLRALQVPFETRQDVLGHKNGNITTHYSAAEVRELLDAVTHLEQAATESRPLTLLRVVA